MIGHSAQTAGQQDINFVRLVTVIISPVVLIGVESEVFLPSSVCTNKRYQNSKAVPELPWKTVSATKKVVSTFLADI